MDDQGFGKINFSNAPSNGTGNKNVPVTSKKVPIPMRKAKKRTFKITRRVVVVGIILLVLVLYVGTGSFIVYKGARKLQSQAKAAYAAVKSQNVVQAKEEFIKTKAEIGNFKKDLAIFAPVGFIPFLGGYYHDGEHMINASSYGVDAALTATNSLIPYADVLGLKGDKSFTSGSAQDRIRLAVKSMGKIVPKIDEIDHELAQAKTEVDQIDANRYPNFWVFKKVRGQVDSLKTLTDEGVLAVQQGKPLIKVLPELLGESGSKKYLIMFQNDKELRPTGGFWTYYSIFNVDEGVLSVDSSANIYDLDDSIPNHPAAPEIIAKYLPNVNRQYIRDINLNPDFVYSVDAFNKMYKTSSRYQKVDGFIALDTQFFVHILNILGEVEAGGQTFNSAIDPRCNCPEAVYILELNTTKPVNYVRENRKSILGDLLYAIMQKALSSSPRQYWGRLVQSAMSDAQEKHILFDLYDSDAQTGIDALGWGGRIDQSFEGDYLNINDANFGGAKSNMYVTSTVKLEYQKDKDGNITNMVTINYKNPYKYSDCNLERGGLCLNATLRNFQRLYVPKGATLVKSRGSEVKVNTKEDLGHTYFESFFRVNPLGTAEITYTYQLPFKLKNGQTLPLLIQKQPGTDVMPYEIDVNGRKFDSFDLTQDKKLEISF